MSIKHTWTAVLATVAVACLLPLSSPGQLAGMALDQANDNFGYYFYNSSSAWQSFTAGTNGHLAAIQAYVYATDDADWSATLEVRQGQGASGVLLASQTVTGDNTNQRRTFVLENPVRQTAGNQYTFVFRNASTGLTVRASANAYAAGQCHHASYDYNFKTWVLASDWSEAAYRDASFTVDSTEIGTAAQLAQFAWLINNGARFNHQTITLTADINLGAHYWVAAGNWPWGGAELLFNGTLDGAGHTVANVFTDDPARSYQGLIGYIGSFATIQNLTVTNLDIHGNQYVGGVVGRAHGVVRDCRTFGRVAGDSLVGGIVGGAEDDIWDCTNSAVIASTGNGIGGIAGSSRGGIYGSGNRGAISGANDVGGIVGSGSDMTDCENSGTVAASNGERTGGIAGSADSLVRRCVNSGNVSGPFSVGGIVGSLQEYNGSIERCRNSGSVSGILAGGIVGISACHVLNCANSGNVSVAEDGWAAGGIAGDMEAGAIWNCANSGSVVGDGKYDAIGGLVGYSGGGELLNGLNHGSVAGGDVAGGLVGWAGEWCMIAHCYWKRTGSAPFDRVAIGNHDGDLADCRSFGEAPGTLDGFVSIEEITTSNLAEALNAGMLNGRDTLGLPLRRWTPGSASAYPALIESRWSDAGNFTTNWYREAETNFVIGTASELAGLAVLVNAGIRFQNQRVTLAADIALGEREWTPIGRLADEDEGITESYFAGKFDGNGKTVSGVYVDADSALEAAGFFGVAGWAIIANLSLADADVAGDRYSGALFGYLGFSWIINNSCSGRVSGDEIAGGVAGATVGAIFNCWSAVHVSGEIAGGLVGSLMEEGEAVGYSYWKRTGVAPYDLPAVGDREDETLPDCHAFTEAPGRLDMPRETAPLTLAQALNDIIKEYGAIDDIGLYGWTAGTATNYPALTALIRVDGQVIPETLSDGFTADLTLAEVDAGVAVYTNAHPATTAATFGALMSQADAMGFTFGDLAADDAMFAFNPSLAITAFDPTAGLLTFRVANGIDATPQAAMNRLAASSACAIIVQQMDAPGGAAVALHPAVAFYPDGTARAAVTPASPSDRALFFRIRVDHASPSSD